MIFIQDPAEIEARSMVLIAPYLEELKLDEAHTKIFSRVIHAAGDPDYANHIRIHSQAVDAAIDAIRGGADIFCDVEMVRTGISKKTLAQYGGQVHCLIADSKVAAMAKQQGITRSMAAFRTFRHQLDGAVVAVGNAPTALFELFRLMEEENVRPAVVIGVPVGFVGAAESKDLLAEKSNAPYITVLGNKGGSPIAVSIVNALLYMMGPKA
ncbi:MAG: precorrin-8X methylmutase [Negativicutes bacterium]